MYLQGSLVFTIIVYFAVNELFSDKITDAWVHLCPIEKSIYKNSFIYIFAKTS